MALTRKFLKAMGIEDEKIEEIITAHTDVTDSLKADRDKYKADAENAYRLERELEEARKDAEAKDKDNGSYKEKYEAEKAAFADFKKEVEAEQTKAKKTAAYKELLKKAGVSDKRIESILKVTAIDEIELDADGAIKDADKKEEHIKEEWADFIVKKSEEGAGTETPPSGAGASGKTMSRAAQVVAAHNARLYGVKGDK